MRVSGNLVVIGATIKQPVDRMNASLSFELLKSCPQSCPHIGADTLKYTHVNKSCRSRTPQCHRLSNHCTARLAAF
jgi:hypothetical protein